MVSQKRQLKEEKIIDAAEKVFFAEGYDYAKMEMVAAEVGMSKASLYFYFKSKEDLYLAITYRAFRLLIDLYHQIIADNKKKTAAERVILILEGYLDFSERHFHYHEALFNYMSLIRSANSPSSKTKLPESVENSMHFAKIRDIHNLPIDIVVREIREGVAEGSIKNQLQPEMIYLTAWALIAGYVKLNIFGGKERETIHKVDLKDWKSYLIQLTRGILEMDGG
ncbi:MAG: TetR/AcrR family transcriptional regulator [Bacteroidota bacterium]